MSKDNKILRVWWCPQIPMTDEELDAAVQDNDGDISAMTSAISSLSHDISTVTNEQKKQLIAICIEMRFLLMGIEGIEG